MANGQTVTLETGKLARQADGAVVVRCGNCMILATVVAAKEPKPGQSFFPLTVDYQEKFASAGRIPGSFFKREGRISDSEVLISRLIDRALRRMARSVVVLADSSKFDQAAPGFVFALDEVRTLVTDDAARPETLAC